MSNPETQYLDRLTAELEAQSSIIQQIEPGLNITQPSARVRQATSRLWQPPGRFMLSSNASGQPLPAGRAFDDIAAAAASYPQFALVGAAGMGKTALIRYLALHAAYAYRASPQVAPLPLLLNLADWEQELTPQAFVQARWPLKSDVMRLLVKGKVALYLEDASDMQPPDKVDRLRHWLTGTTAPQRVIVTSRTPLKLGLPTLQILDLTPAAIRDWAIHYLGDDGAKRFLAQVLPTADNRARVHYHYQMARHPFLLSGLIALYRRAPDQKLPATRGLLVQQLVTALWNAQGQAAPQNIVPFEAVETALAALAFQMTDDNLPLHVSQDAVEQVVNSPVVVQAAIAANLLQPQGTKYRFTQQQMQDYFAALELARVGLPTRLTRPQFDVNVQRATMPWDNAISFLTSLSPNPDATVMGVAEVDPYLALRCALQAVMVSDRTYNHLTRQILETPGDQRIALARVFIGLDDEKAMLILLEVMRDAAWPIRQYAASVLADVDLPLLPGLAQAIENLEDRTRETTLIALRQLGKSALPTLVHLLRSHNWHQRRGAAWALGELRDKAAVPLLVEMLSDTDHLVSADAADALSTIGDTAAVPALLDALGHQKERVAQNAAQALANLGKPALPPLLKVLDGKISSPQRQVYALEALARLDDPAAAAALLDASYMENVEVRGAAVEGLRHFQGETVVNRLVECLSDAARPRNSKQRIGEIAADSLNAMRGTDGKTAFARWRQSHTVTAARPVTASSQKAKNRLERVKETAVALSPSLATGLKDPDWVVRRNAVLELGMMDAAAAGPRLEQMLDDEDSQVRLAVVQTLAQFRDAPQAVTTLISALNDQEYVVCDAAKEALKQLAPSPQPALVEILRGSSVNMRGAALEILGSIRDAAAVPEICDCLADLQRPWLSDERICDIAASALESIGTPEALEAVQQWRSLNTPMPAAVEAAPTPEPPSDDVLAQLLDQLQAPDWGVRQQAARALNEHARALRGVADAAVIQRVIPALRDSHWVVRFSAAEALGWFRDATSGPALIECITDVKWKVRVAVVRSLAEIGDLAAVEPIIAALHDSHHLVREAAAEALGNLNDPRAVDGLVAAMDDNEPFVRLAAIDALGKLRDPATINALVSQLNQNDPAVRCYAVYALAQIGQKPVVSGLIASLDDTAKPYWEKRRICDIAAEALENIATPEARAAVWEWRRQQARPPDEPQLTDR